MPSGGMSIAGTMRAAVMTIVDRAPYRSPAKTNGGRPPSVTHGLLQMFPHFS